MRHLTLVLVFLVCALGADAQNYPIGVRTVTYTDAARSNRSVGVEVHYPAVSAGSNAALANDTFPFVIFGHGFQMTGSAYYPFADSLARRGYIVALANTETGLSPSHPNFAQDFIFLYNTLISESANAASPFYHHVTSRGAIGGHSMGGGCTVLSAQYGNPATCYFTFAEATTNPSSITAASSMTKPYLSFAGSYDCIAPYSTNQQPTYDSSHSPCKVMVNIIGASHCQFGLGNFQCNFGEGVSGCANPPLSRTAQINTVLRYLQPYLDYYLKGICRSWTSFDSVYNSDAVNTKTRNCTNVVPASASITGPTSFCAGSSATLTALPRAFQYSWSNGQTTDSISVSTAGNYYVTVGNGTCSIRSGAVTETVLNPPASLSAISGSDTLCANSDSILYSVPAVSGATTYNWTLPSGWVIKRGAGTTNLYLSVNGTTGTITVNASNSCGTTANISKIITVKPTAQLTGSIAGADSLCANSDSVLYSVSAAAGATSYQWSVPAGWSIRSGGSSQNVYISSNNTTGPVTVKAINGCGAGNTLSKTITVISIPVLTGAIIGADTVCVSSDSVLYSVAAAASAASYHWTVPSGWIVRSGTGTNRLFISFNGIPGTLTVDASNRCGTSNMLSKSISFDSVPHFAGTISGADTVCLGSSLQVYTFAGSTDGTLQWSVSSPYTITSGQTTGTVHISGVTAAGTVTLSSSGACGQSTPISLHVAIVDTAHIAGTLSGADTVCVGHADQVYTFAGTNSGSLLWTVSPPYSITSGQTTNSIQVSGINTSGAITLVSSGICGQSAPLVLPIEVRDTPQLSGTISGADTICIGHPDQSYTFTGTNVGSLSWSVSTPYSITSGQGTTAISTSGVNFNGTITLVSSNSCGRSVPVSFQVAVVDTPHTAVVQSHDTLRSSVTGSTYQWYLNGQAISSANSQFYIPVDDGNYTVVITNANGCEGSSAVYNYVGVGIGDIAGQQIAIYPNPAANVIYIRTERSIKEVQVTDGLGKVMISEAKVTDRLDISYIAAGMYFMQVITDDDHSSFFRICKK